MHKNANFACSRSILSTQQSLKIQIPKILPTRQQLRFQRISVVPVGIINRASFILQTPILKMANKRTKVVKKSEKRVEKRKKKKQIGA